MKRKAYKIRIVSPEVYKEVVPHKDMADKTFGFTRKNRGEIYVKKASSEKETMDRLSHEMEEVWASKSPHSIDGVRYGLFSKVGQWLEKTFLPEKVKETVSDIPILGDALSRGWLGAIPQQFTQEGQEAYAKDTGTAGILRKYIYPAVIGALGGGALGAGLYGAGSAPHTKDIPMSALSAAGMGSIGSGLANWAQPGGTGFMADFGAGVSDSVGGLPGFGEGGILSNLTLPGFGEGGMFAGGATGTGSASGAQYLSDLGLGNVSQAGQSLLGGGNIGLSGAIPGSNLMAGGGASNTGLLSKILGLGKDVLGGGTGGGETNWLKKLLPTLIQGGMYLGQQAPERPAFQPAPEVGMASQTYQDLLGQIQSQDFMSPIQDYLDLQQEQDVRDLRTQAAGQGWLDSSMFAERQADIGKQYGVAGGLNMADLEKWGIGQSSDIAGQLGNIGQYLTGTPYQAEMDVYNQEEASRQALLQNIFSQLGSAFSGNSIEEYLQKILAG